ncbi:MAG: HNH endonuclease, partial [Cyanobacteria bacterium J06635_10]
TWGKGGMYFRPNSQVFPYFQGTVEAPYDGDIIYWSQRESKHYDNVSAKLIKKQNYKCASCGLKFIPGEEIHLHHIDGKHNNWKIKNLETIHRSCHQYQHMSRSAD